MKKLQSINHVLQAKRISFVFLFLMAAVHSIPFAAHADVVRSKAAIVMEASTGRVLYGKNPNLKLAPASTVKLMTAMVALDKVDINEVVIISEKASAVPPIKANFKTGEKVTVKTLLYAALMRSANDAAFALAETVAGSEEKFAELMNEKALSLGISDTRFINSTGLPGQGQYTTVYDLSRMLRHALRYPLIKEIISIKESNITTEDGRAIFLKNINKLLWEDDSMLGGKTGYTRQARHCFVCAGHQANETVIVAVMGAPDRETLWKESESLLGKGFAVKNSREEPVVYFTRSDYKALVHKASYKTVSAGIKKASYRKDSRKMKGKKIRVKSYAKNRGIQKTQG